MDFFLTALLSGLLALGVFCQPTPPAMAHFPEAGELGSHSHEAVGDASGTSAVPGHNPWNKGKEPEDWWATVNQRHGHVGPWNVLGYRIAKAMLREMKANWGEHALEITCHIPVSTPFSCLVDGLAVGSGNSQGRLDLRIGEVATWDFIHISAREKMGDKKLVIKPRKEYLHTILDQPVTQLESLSRKCVTMEETELFDIYDVYQAPKGVRTELQIRVVE